MKETTETQLATLSAHFSKLEQFCGRPKEGQTIGEIFRKLQESIASLGKGSPSGRRELLEDLQVRVSTWLEVWPRLGKDIDFRNAVAREARIWSKKLAEAAKRP